MLNGLRFSRRKKIIVIDPRRSVRQLDKSRLKNIKLQDSNMPHFSGKNSENLNHDIIQVPLFYHKNL